MALIHDGRREILCKVVYFGARSAGKTTNLVQIYQRAPRPVRGDVLTIPVHGDSSVWFDLLPLDVGAVAGYRVRFHLLTAPGLPVGAYERAAVLNGADGVIVVVDSQRARFADNVRSVLELTQILASQKRRCDSLSWVVQYNKRDLPDAVPIPILDARLNPTGAPIVEAVATTGVGVFASLRLMSQQILQRLSADHLTEEQQRASYS